MMDQQYPWTIENGILRLGFDTDQTLEAVSRPDIRPRQNIEENDALFGGSPGLYSDMSKLFILLLMRAKLDSLFLAARLPDEKAFYASNIQLLGDTRTPGTKIFKELQQVKSIVRRRRFGRGFHIRNPFLKKQFLTQDYGR